MTMRAPSSELPIVFDGVTVTAGSVMILDDIALTLAPGEHTLCLQAADGAHAALDITRELTITVSG